MAPGILTETTSVQDSTEHAHAPKPLKLTGVLEKFDYEEVTPVIGREFPTLNIVDDLINAENADELLRELAITSKAYITTHHYSSLTDNKSLVAALCSSAHKPISPMIFKSSS